MRNLLQETLAELAENGKSPADVGFVKTLNSEGSWADFVELADFEYDAGYGGNKIDLSLKIVGADWWLERGEYDGSEWWEFKTMPTKAEDAPKITTVRER